MKQELVNLAKELIKFETVTGNIDSLDSCMDFILNQLDGYNIDVKRYYFNEVPLLLLSFPGNHLNKVFLNGHIDVVPGKPEQFIPKISGNKLYGRGSVDMKGAVAVFIKLMQDLSKWKKPPRLSLMLVSDEESSHYSSTNRLLDKGFLCEFGICGEPTQLKIGTKCKGMSAYDVKVTGKASHGSRPWEGQNAILKTFYKYRKIQKYFDNKKGWHSTINLTMIQGGNARNATPDECRIALDVRYTDMDEILEIDKLMQRTFGSDLAKQVELAVMNTPPKNKYVKLLKNAHMGTLKKNAKFIAQYGSSDAVAFAQKEIPAVEFGPKGQNWHGPNEYVEIDSLVKYYNILKKFAKSV